MTGARVLLLLLVVGCARPAPPPAAPAAPPPPPPVSRAPVCITVPEAAAPITRAHADGTSVRYCVGDGDACFALELATGALTRLAPPPAAPASAAPSRAVSAPPSLEVCTGDACKALTTKVLPGSARLRAASTADGGIVVVLLGDAVRGQGAAEVWDVARAKKLAQFRYARGDYRCGDVAILGDTIYLSADTCGASPAARGALYTLRGRRLAYVGGREFGVYGQARVPLAGARWAFLDENGRQLVVQDVATGKLVRTLDTRAVFADAGAEMGNPGESALVALGDGRLAVVAGAPATGSVIAIDPGSGTQVVVRAPQCQ